MLSEDNLRKVMAKCFGKDIIWVEPARGSSVGIPDCEITVGDMQVKIELKWWLRTRKGLRCVMRPAQIRFHVMAARKGDKQTAIMWGTEVSGSTGEYAIHLLNGRHCPMHPYANQVLNESRIVGYSLHGVDELKKKIMQILGDFSFWL